MANVEELLNDFDWKEAGNAAALEERLLDELAALESVSLNQLRGESQAKSKNVFSNASYLNFLFVQANIHAMVESDDRLNSVIRQLDKAISELDNMDSMLTLYTTELNVSHYHMNCMIVDLNPLFSRNLTFHSRAWVMRSIILNLKTEVYKLRQLTRKLC